MFLDISELIFKIMHFFTTPHKNSFPILKMTIFIFTEQRSPNDDEFEGVLVRKHEWESTTKKATNRSWDKVYMVIRGQTLVTYKDQKTCKTSPEQTFKGEYPLDIRGASIQVANDYTKKKHVFRVK